MLVSRKYLSLIHLVARKLASRVHVTKAVVEFRDFRRANSARSVLNEPFAEGIDQGSVLAARYFAGTCNGSLVGTKGDVFHIALSISRSSHRARTFAPHLHSGAYSSMPDTSVLEHGLRYA